MAINYNSFTGFAGGFKVTKTNTPLDCRFVIEKEADIHNVPSPYVGCMIYAIEEDKFFVIKSLKDGYQIMATKEIVAEQPAGDEWVDWMVAPKALLDVYEEFAGGSGGEAGAGMTEEEKEQLRKLIIKVGYEGESEKPEHYIESDQYTTGSLKVIADGSFPSAIEVNLSEANKNGGNFSIGDYVLKVDTVPAFEGDGLAEQVRKNTEAIGESGEPSKAEHYELVVKEYAANSFLVVSDDLLAAPDGCIKQKDALDAEGNKFNIGDHVILMPEIPEVEEAYKKVEGQLEKGLKVVSNGAASTGPDEVKVSTANMNGGDFYIGDVVVFREATARVPEHFERTVATSKDALIIVDSNKSPLEANEVKLSEVNSINPGQFVVGDVVKFVPGQASTLAHFEYPKTIYPEGTKTIIAADSQYVEADEIKISEVEALTAGLLVGDKVVYVPHKDTSAEYYILDVGAYKEEFVVVSDVKKDGCVLLSDANMNGGNFSIGDKVKLVQGQEGTEGTGILGELDKLKGIAEIIGQAPVEGIEANEIEYYEATLNFPSNTLEVVDDAVTPGPNQITKSEANINQPTLKFNAGSKVVKIEEIQEVAAHYELCDKDADGAMVVVPSDTEDLQPNQIRQSDLDAFGGSFDLWQIVRYVPAVNAIPFHYEAAQKTEASYNDWCPPLTIVEDGGINGENQIEISKIIASGSLKADGSSFQVGDIVHYRVKGTENEQPVAGEEAAPGSGILGTLADHEKRIIELEKLHDIVKTESLLADVIIEEVSTLDKTIYKAQEDVLPSSSVHYMVTFPGEGFRIETSDTLSTMTSSNDTHKIGSYEQKSSYLETRHFEAQVIYMNPETGEEETKEVFKPFDIHFIPLIYSGAVPIDVNSFVVSDIETYATNQEYLESMINEEFSLDVFVTADNEYDFLVVPKGQIRRDSYYNPIYTHELELQSVMQNGLNITDTYDRIELFFNDIECYVYISKWKQTITNGKKTFNFKKVIKE